MYPNVLNSSQIGIVVTIFWGTTKLGLNHSDYVGVLTILGLITGINLFCVIVVFQVRLFFTKNISLKLESFRTCHILFLVRDIRNNLSHLSVPPQHNSRRADRLGHRSRSHVALWICSPPATALL